MTEASAVAEQAAEPQPAEPSKPLLQRGPRLALGVFVVVELIAFPLFLWGGEKQWFFLDDFDFLAARSLGDPIGLLRPHFEHWTTLPIIAYRGMWEVFGLRSYVPYQYLSIASHLVVVALLRVVMRRAGVGPWIATLVASVIALFGVGQENMVWAFQITFTWALLFGLTQLLLSDRQGPIDRRDWLGLLAGLAAIMCSGPGVVMVAVVGLATLVRRGWKQALFHAVPLLAIYGLWTIVFGQRSEYGSTGPPGPQTFAAYVWRGVAATFDGLGQLPTVGWLLGAALVLGFIVAWRVTDTRTFVRLAAGSIVVGGAVLFLGVTAWGRAVYYGVDRGGESRYLYMVAAMCAPALAFALNAIVEKWPRIAPVMVVLLLVGVPGNVAAVDDRPALLRGDPFFVLTLPRVESAARVPADATPPLDVYRDVTIGWLRDGVADGRIPEPATRLPAVDARAKVALALVQEQEPGPTSNCRRLDVPVRVQPQVGDRFGIQGGVVQVRDASYPKPRVGGAWSSWEGETLLVRAPSPPLELAALGPPKPIPTVCGLPDGS